MYDKPAIRRACEHKMTFCLITSGTLFATLCAAHDLHLYRASDNNSDLFVKQILSIGTQNSKYWISLKELR